MADDPDHFDPRATDYVYGEVVEVLCQALIRGAFCVINGVEKRVTHEDVLRIKRHYFDEIGPQQMPINNAWALAFAVVSGRILGFTPKEPDPKAEPGSDPATPTSE